MNDNNNKEDIFFNFEKVPLKSEREEKKTNTKHIVITCMLCVLFLLVGFVLGGNLVKSIHPTTKTNASKTIAEIEAVLKLGWLYADDYDDFQKELENKAFYGMTKFDEDPYTTYMSKEEMDEFTNTINMDYVGIGVQYSTKNNIFIIQRVFAQSPAEKAGLLPGDIIVGVNGDDVQGLSSDEVKNLVLGEEGSKVVINVIRNNEKLNIDVIRGKVDHSVYCYTEDDYVVIELESFGSTTGKECMAYLDQYLDYHKAIIDLRDNTGGYQASVKEIAGLFIGNGKVYLKQKDAHGNEVSDLTSCIKTYDNFDKIILLVNNNTASAAEVFAICLKEQLDCVTIVGETTYGKGVIQSNHYLSNGGDLKFSSYYWYSPNGVSIHKTGISPDYEVKQADITYEYYLDVKDDEKYEYDSVSDVTKVCQMGLDYLGYNITRKDGYFDDNFVKELRKYKVNNNLSDDSVLDKKTYESIIADDIARMSEIDYDNQMQKAIELIKE